MDELAYKNIEKKYKRVVRTLKKIQRTHPYAPSNYKAAYECISEMVTKELQKVSK